MTTEEEEQQQQTATRVEETPLKNGNGEESSEPQQPEQPEQEQQQQQEQTDSTLEIPSEQQQQQEQPEIAPALAAQGGREVSRKILYVGGLDKSITEDSLREIFSAHGTVESVKILFDKNKQSFNYAFVEFEQEQCAKVAFDALNGSIINNSELKINWAYQSQQAKSNPEHFNIFVGDLSTELDDDQLRKSFSNYQSLVQAHVMWDMQSGRSRGYGFVSFSEQQDAEDALNQMNGATIGNRQIRLNWASHKQQQPTHHNNGYHHSRGGYHNRHHNNHLNGLPTNGYAATTLMNGGAPLPPLTNGNPSAMNGAIGANGIPMNGGAINGGAVANAAQLNLLSTQTYDLMLRKSPSWQTTVYLGNLAHYTTQNDLIPFLQNYGFLVDLKFHPERNCAFAKFDSHERAAMAIVQLNGFNVNGRPLKTGWGKDRPNHQSNNLQYPNYGQMLYQGR